MPARNTAVTEPAERVLVITRDFDAPRSLVFKAWTSPEHLMRWWGPHGFTVLSCDMDLRVGGAWHLRMRSPTGVEDRQVGVIRELVEPELLVFSYAFADESGKPGHETTVTVRFADLGAKPEGKTRLTVHQAVFESVKVRDDHVNGWGEALDHLADYVKRNQE